MHSKIKLKTLPHQSVYENQEFAFKSACEDVFSCASPTFASTQQISYNDAFSKENEKPHNYGIKPQQGLVKHEALQAEYRMLQKKYEVCSKNLEGKLEKSVKKLYSSNTCQSNEEAVNLILELKAMAEEVKSCKNENRIMKVQNEELQEKNRYLEKELSKKRNVEQSSMKVELVKEKYDEKIQKIQKGKEEIEQKLRKQTEKYQNLHFLKTQIENKRNEDLRIRNQIEETLERVKLQNEELSSQNEKLLEGQKQLQKTINEMKILNNETYIQLKQQLKLQKENSLMLKNRINEEVSEKIKKTQDYDKEKKQIKMKKEKYENQRHSLEETIKDLQDENKALKASIEQQKDKKQKIKNEKRTLEEQFKKEREKLNKEKASLEAELLRKVQNLKEISKQTDEISQQLKHQQQKCLKLKEEIYQKNNQLQDSARKIEELENAKERKNWDISKHKIPTKTIFQLRMATSIISQILDIENVQYSGTSKEQNEVEYLVNRITELSEQTADYFDELNEKADDLCLEIEKKEDMIATVLKFSPQEKRNSILNYLNIMESKFEEDERKIQQIINETQLEAQNWKTRLEGLMKAEEELKGLKRQLKQKPELSGERNYWRKEEGRLMRRQGIKRKYMQQ